MTLGPFLFGAPLALIGLIALPIIWWVLRATPPTPKAVELPSLRLLDDVDPNEETPAKTPWWLLLLRLAAAALAILGLSLPLYAPGAQSGDAPSGPVLVVIDDGWTSAERWSELRDAALIALDGEDRDTPAHLLLTAPRTLNTDPSERLSRADFTARLRSLEPYPWTVDREDALARLNESGLQPSRILYASNGLDPETAEPFVRALMAKAPLAVYAAPPRGPAAITSLSANAGGAIVTLRRAEDRSANDYFVSALTLDGAALATAEASFASGEREATATFTLPPAALSRITRFQVTGSASPGTIWLWDSADRSRRIGLVSGDATAQPLLSDMHYIRKALEPFASITEGDLTALIEDNPDAIILTDIGQIDPSVVGALTDWVEEGGALIRFAGPRMAANGDTLVPAPLRRASRAIGGALTWETPQALGEFPETSPFAGLTPPEDIRVRQQVLARPGPELARRTWARLADGSPLVTADQRGRGTLILFHVTAGPDWSDLAYSGLFVDMLRRSIAAGKGEAVADAEGLYTPRLTLNGRGQLSPASTGATPLVASDFGVTDPSETHPPGLYQGPAGTRALNTAVDYQPIIVEDWPSGATLLGDAEARTMRLAGPLLGLAAILLALDIIVALSIAGRFQGRRKTTTAAFLFALSAPIGLQSQPAEAQGFQFDPPRPAVQRDPLPKDIEAALDMRLAYIETGDARTDRRTREGLNGVTLTLFRRTSVEPAEPHAVNADTDALDVYPILFLVLPDNPEPMSETAIARLNAYMRGGGTLFIDTRAGGTIGQSGFDGLGETLPGLDTPQLTPTPDEHVLTKSFYLLSSFPGRYAGRPLWIEATSGTSRDERRGDGVSRLLVTDADYVSAWAVDDRGRSLYSVDGGDEQRERALRFGVNLVMYVLTGNYKEDQVHIPALLERLGEEGGVGDFENDGVLDLDDIVRPVRPGADE
ncbi:MAG: DUF4159 domain-containing protein [Pseudomonadota bacterium]